MPSGIVTNTDLEAIVDTSDEWIATRTGIRERRVLAHGETLCAHAGAAAERALEAAGCSASDVDLVILATSSADDVFGTACAVQAYVGASNAVAFDITAACSGFVVALITGAHYIRCGTYAKVLVVGGDALSRFVDWSDRNTCVLFGDGCGAALLEAQPSSLGCNLLGFAMESDGNGRKHLNTEFALERNHQATTAPAEHSASDDPRGRSQGLGQGEEGKEGKDGKEGKEAEGSARLSVGAANLSPGCGGGRLSLSPAHGGYTNLHMSGQDVFKWAVRAVPSVIQRALDASVQPDGTPLGVEDIDWLVLHQANQRILSSASSRLGIAPDKVVTNIARYGNTSAGSVPLALDEAVREGKIKRGDVIATAGFGAGLTCASALFKWG